MADNNDGMDFNQPMLLIYNTSVVEPAFGIPEKLKG